MKLWWIALCLGLATHGASAQTIYRCGWDGRSYSQQPCADGRAIEVDDARSDRERREGQAAADRQARALRTMERERLDAQATPKRPLRIDGRSSPQADRSPHSPAARDFRAVNGPAKKRSTRRTA